MTSGFQVNGTDLDSIFAPLGSGWPQASATSFDVGGVDLNARYATLATGSAASSTGYQVSGSDINGLFAALGTTAVVVASQPSAVSGSTAAGQPSGTVTSNSTSCSGSKGKGSYSFTWVLASGSGASFTSPSSSSTAVTGTVNAGSTISGTMYCTISDGTTSANTSTVSWSLQNTTPAGYSFSITAGTQGSNTGYSNGTNTGGGVYGTINSPSGGVLASGKDIAAVYDNTSVGAELVITNLSSDPGQNSLVSITINGHTYTGSSASYLYGGTTSRWTWGSPFGLSNGVSYSGNIVSSGAW